MNAITPQPSASTPGALMEQVITKGDLSKLTPQERSNYYVEVCKSVGLNPLTKPFEYITLNGKLTLYALRNCTDQLRTIYGVSVEELAESEREGVFIVTAKVRTASGRTDIAKGAVSITGLKGEALANALMRAETKAKRRATLSACGLGLLDETEVETMPTAKRAAPTPAPLTLATPHDHETGEVADDDERDDPLDAPDAAAVAVADPISLEDTAREAAMRGEDVFQKFYKGRSAAEKARLNKMGDELRGLMPT